MSQYYRLFLVQDLHDYKTTYAVSVLCVWVPFIIMRKSCFLLLWIADKILRKFFIKFLAFFKNSYTANSDEMNVKNAENNNLKNYIPQN